MNVSDVIKYGNCIAIASPNFCWTICINVSNNITVICDKHNRERIDKVPIFVLNHIFPYFFDRLLENSLEALHPFSRHQ